MIKIVNRKTHHGESVYVGRPSVLGNPFVIGRDGDRETVIQQYRCWLWGQLQRGSGEVFDEIYRLAQQATTGELVLACWCAPEKCHAEIIRSAVEWINNQSQDVGSKTMTDLTDNTNETTEERQCLCCGSYDGDPYTILSNGYCIPCDRDAEISALETETRLRAAAESLAYDRQLD